MKNRSSGQPPWEKSIRLFTHPRRPGEPDGWHQGDVALGARDSTRDDNARLNAGDFE
jgi:hypothetical protein